MADKASKFPENAAGRYYTDESCIACGACVGEAPENFKMSDDESFAFVFKQPENDTEEQACVSALEVCPVNAIGNDG